MIRKLKILKKSSYNRALIMFTNMCPEEELEWMELVLQYWTTHEPEENEQEEFQKFMAALKRDMEKVREECKDRFFKELSRYKHKPVMDEVIHQFMEKRKALQVRKHKLLMDKVLKELENKWRIEPLYRNLKKVLNMLSLDFVRELGLWF